MEGDLLLLYLIVGIILIIIVLGILIWAIISVAKSSTGKEDQEQETKQTARTAQEMESAASSRSLPSARNSSQALDHACHNLKGVRIHQIVRVYGNDVRIARALEEIPVAADNVNVVFHRKDAKTRVFRRK